MKHEAKEEQKQESSSLVESFEPQQILIDGGDQSQKFTLNEENDNQIQVLGNPQDMENCLDLTEEISKEILLHLRIRLGK